MRTTKLNTRSLSLGVAFGLVALPALAQGADGPATGTVTVGSQSGTGLNQSSKLRQFESIPTTPTIYDANLLWKGAAGYWMEYQGTNIGVEDQTMSLRGGKQGEFKWAMVWDQTPNWSSNTAQTPYVQTDPGVFRLPDALRSAMQSTYWTPGAGAITVAASDPRNVALGAALGFYTLPTPYTALNTHYFFQPIDLKTLRRTGKADFEFQGFEHWVLGLSYSQERKNGNQATTIFDGTSILEVAAPIDYKTQNLGFRAEYANGRWFGSGAVEFSKFEDGVQRLYIDNPMRLTNDPAQLNGSYRQQQAAVFGDAMYPDNQATTFSLSGGLNLPMHHRLVVTYTLTQMDMDTALMAGSTIPYYPDQTNGLSSVAAKMDNSLITARLTGDPKSLFGYSLTLRKFELKDKTQPYSFSPIGRGDSTAPSASTTFTHNDAGWDKDSLKAEVHVSPLRGLRFGLAAGRDKATYEDREAREVVDNTLTFTADARLKLVMFHASYTDLRREPTYVDDRTPLTWAGTAPANPAANTTDQAKRDSKLYNALATFTPTDAWAITLSAFGVDNKFPDSQVHGMQSSKNDNYGVDFTYAMDEKLSLVAAYVFETYKYAFTSQYLGANATTAFVQDRWGNNTDDKVDTYKIGLRWKVSNRFDLSTDYDYSKGRSDSAYVVNNTYVTSNGTVGSYQGQGYLIDPRSSASALPYGYSLADAGPYLSNPEVVNATTIWKTRFNYHATKHLTFSFMYWMQKYERADWARDMMKPYMYSVDPGANKSLFLGVRVPSYDANLFRASVSYRF